MNHDPNYPNDLDELRSAVDDLALVLGEGDVDELQLTTGDGQAVGSWQLSKIVDDLLDLMATPAERDDMLDLARHLDSLVKRIRRTIADIEANEAGD